MISTTSSFDIIVFSLFLSTKIPIQSSSARTCLTGGLHIKSVYAENDIGALCMLLNEQVGYVPILRMRLADSNR